MINLYLYEGENRDYLEIHVDGEGCASFLDALAVLQTNGNVKIEAGITMAKDGFRNVPSLILKFVSIEHFGDTDCNIWCRKLGQSVEMQLTHLGVDELRWIIECVQASGDHYHFIGGFNLYVKGDTRDEIRAANLYFD